jgi:hypothetical protein
MAHWRILRQNRPINAGAVGALSRYKMLYANLMPDKVDRYPVWQIIHSDCKLQEPYRTMLCTKDLFLPFRSRILSFSLSNRVHGSVLDFLPVVSIVD